MKKFLVVLLSLGLFLGLSTAAFASNVDVKEFGTGYFVDSEANTYNSPYYRWYGQDWGWNHGGLTDTIDTNLGLPTLFISAWDVDAAQGEVDNIYAYDEGVKTLLGSLQGANDDWGYTTFILGSNFYDEIAEGLEIFMEIDVYGSGWAVTLAKSALTINGGTPPPPPPGAVPEPATMVLFGLGLLGLAGVSRKK